MNSLGSISWRSLTSSPTRPMALPQRRGRFATVRICHAGGNTGPARLDRSNGCSSNCRQPKPNQVSTFCPRCLRKHRSRKWSASPVSLAHRARLPGFKEGFGLGQNEGTRPAGFHPYAALGIAGYKSSWQSASSTSQWRQKIHRTPSACPPQGIHCPRQSCAQRHVATYITARA